MEERRFLVPEGDRDTRDDLHSITKAITSTGAVRLVHDGQSDGHGDRFWAAALCSNAASGAVAEYDYRPVARATALDGGQRRDDDDDFRRRHGGAFANQDAGRAGFNRSKGCF
jgi:phage FluMu gp28-like protein